MLDLLSKVADAAPRTEQVAQTIRSRDAFRISNQTNTALLQNIEKYDQILLTIIPMLIDTLTELKGLLKAAGT
jgi:hypothetical protein